MLVFYPAFLKLTGRLYEVRKVVTTYYIVLHVVGFRPHVLTEIKEALKVS